MLAANRSLLKEVCSENLPEIFIVKDRKGQHAKSKSFGSSWHHYSVVSVCSQCAVRNMTRGKFDC